MSTQAQAVAEIARLIDKITELGQVGATWKARAEKAEGELRAARVKSRILGLCEGFEAGATSEVRAVAAELAKALADRDAANALVGEMRKVMDIFARAYRISMAPFNLAPEEGARAWMPGGWPAVGEFADVNAALARTPTEALDALKERLRREVLLDLVGETSQFDANQRAWLWEKVNHPDAPKSSEEGR